MVLEKPPKIPHAAPPQSLNTTHLRKTIDCFWETDPRNVRQVLDTNLFGTYLVTRAVTNMMRQQTAQPMRGHIVNVSSSLAYKPRAGLSVYAASKAAVSALTQAFALELGPRNITVNAVAPALTRTDMTAPIPDEVRARMRESTPLGRLAEPEDIADTIAFLASDDARWITGRTLLTDGGFI